MANICDLGVSISELSDEELHARIRDLRTARRVKTERTKKRQAKTKAKAQANRPKKKKTVKNLKSLAAMMSTDERAELIKLLEESL